MHKFSKIIHFNRDENSFTARVFEALLLPLWANNPLSFSRFIDVLKQDSNRNELLITNKFKKSGIKSFHSNDEIFYVDAMLFLENLDVHGFCKNNQQQIDLDENNIDKTEFDCVVVAEDKNGDEYAFIFEVKCFTDLKVAEIKRQNEIFEIYKKSNLFKDFYHFAIISNENINRASIFDKKELDDLTNGLFIIDWTCVFDYINDFTIDSNINRFIKEIEFGSLYKTVSYNGNYKNKRNLIDKNRSTLFNKNT